MAETPSLHIQNVIDGWDMRIKHPLREKAIKNLKPGQCIVALNGCRDKAAVFDHMGGIYSIWADPGQRFDIDTISHMMTMGIKVSLRGVVKYDKELQLVA